MQTSTSFACPRHHHQLCNGHDCTSFWDTHRKAWRKSRKRRTLLQRWPASTGVEIQHHLFSHPRHPEDLTASHAYVSQSQWCSANTSKAVKSTEESDEEMVKFNKEHYPNGLNHKFGAKTDVLFETFGNVTGHPTVTDPCMRNIRARAQPSPTAYTAQVLVASGSSPGLLSPIHGVNCFSCWHPGKFENVESRDIARLAPEIVNVLGRLRGETYTHTHKHVLI